MAKIISVEIWGFQSHAETQYGLHPGLNVFTGPTDGGKTAGTIRALRWLAKGEPSGEDFLYTVRDAEGNIIRRCEEAGVTVRLDNGIRVSKVRRKGKTQYFVTGYDEPFEKAEVPEAVKQALGIVPVVYSRDANGKPDLEYDLHFAYQLAAPFLISDPGSAGAKVLGKLAGTEAVDGAIKAIAKDTYAARQEKAEADKEYERKVVQLQAFEGIDDLQRQLDACEARLKEVETFVQRKNQLTAETVALQNVKVKLNGLAAKLDKLAVVPQLEEDLKAIEKAQQRYDVLLDLYERFGKATATVERLSESLKSYARLLLAERHTAEAATAFTRCANLADLLALYTRSTTAVNKAQAVIDRASGLETAEAGLRTGIESLRKWDELQAHRTTYSLAVHREQRATGILDKLTGVPEAETLLRTVSEMLDLRVAIGILRMQLTVKADTILTATDRLERADETLLTAEEELTEAWNDADGICPLCEQPITGGHAHGS